MRVLFINACVRECSRTAQLACWYLECQHKADPVQEIILQEANPRPLDGAMLAQRDKDVASGDFSNSCYDDAKAFSQAEEIIIAAPYWDYSFPALLKVYLEHISVSGLTFGYEHGRPVGLCKAKKLVYFTTAGGYLAVGNSLERYLDELCMLFGIPEHRLYKAEGLDIHRNDPDEILSAAKEKIAAEGSTVL